jgi:hypothetical protein
MDSDAERFADEGVTGFGQIAASMWSQKLFIAACAIAGVIVVSLSSLLAEPDYTVKMIIMPPPDGGVSSLLSQFGSLASAASSLTGLRVPSAESPNFTAVVQLLNSPHVLAEMDRRYGVLKLFYPKRWDAEHKTWTANDGALSSLVAGVKYAFHIPVHPTPTADDLALSLRNRFATSQIEFTNLTEVTFRYKDPELAAQFLTWDVNVADSIVRAEAMARIQGEIAYIDERLKTVAVEEHRHALGDLLSNLERQNMIIAGGGNYAALVLQAPTVSVRPTLTGLALQLLIGFLAGAVLSAAFVLLLPSAMDRLNKRLGGVFSTRPGVRAIANHD